jgi:hypothetical protein
MEETRSAAAVQIANPECGFMLEQTVVDLCAEKSRRGERSDIALAGNSGEEKK